MAVAAAFINGLFSPADAANMEIDRQTVQRTIQENEELRREVTELKRELRHALDETRETERNLGRAMAEVRQLRDELDRRSHTSIEELKSELTTVVETMRLAEEETTRQLGLLRDRIDELQSNVQTIGEGMATQDYGGDEGAQENEGRSFRQVVAGRSNGPRPPPGPPPLSNNPRSLSTEQEACLCVVRTPKDFLQGDSPGRRASSFNELIVGKLPRVNGQLYKPEAIAVRPLKVRAGDEGALYVVQFSCPSDVTKMLSYKPILRKHRYLDRIFVRPFYNAEEMAIRKSIEAKVKELKHPRIREGRGHRWIGKFSCEFQAANQTSKVAEWKDGQVVIAESRRARRNGATA